MIAAIPPTALHLTFANPLSLNTNLTRLFSTCIMFVACSLAAGAADRSPADTTIKIAIASDSTAATWSAPHPERGWGQYLSENFDERVVIENFAKPGASTRTFLDGGLWAQAIASHPNYVLIQFGHNDSHTPDHPEHTDAAGLYRQLLRRFVREARATGATPILITPVARRTPEDTLVPYAEAMKAVATETHTPLIDLHRLSQRLYARLGPGVQEEVGARKSDLSHFNEAGAKRIARIVAEELSQAVPDLRKHDSNRNPIVR